ncbi:unnamed protein product [Meloidogyne enterolobii]|uniref:Uncharacterized protein n=3 Tax=Meloidogyne enterolobii TaxID=390850 RepID=A0ACB1AAJ7_MELEN|nr:unnamed protein product [Meloidogyne enterolobii]
MPPASKKVRANAVSQSAKAGLKFPVARIRRMLRERNYAKRLSRGAPVFLAAVLEYLVSEIIDGAGNIAKRDKRFQITPRHLFLAIKEDNELKDISEHVTIVQGGVVPGILNELLPPKKKVAAVDTPPKPSKPQQKKPKEKMSSTKKKNVRQGSVSRNEPQHSLEDIGEENDC